MKNKEKKMKRCAFIVYTKYQLLAVLNLVSYDHRDTENDIYIYEDLYGTIDIKLLYNTELFSNVYKINFSPDYHGWKKLKLYLLIFKFDKYYNKTIGLRNEQIQSYDECYCSSLRNVFTALFFIRYRDAKVHIFEDGIGTYESFNKSLSYKINIFDNICRTILRRGKSIRISSVYVYRPDLMIENRYPICEIKSNRLLENYSTLTKIFMCDDNDHLKDIQFIYFEQPNDMMVTNYLSVEESIKSILLQNRKRTIVRLHPRDLKRTQFYSEFICENSGMWELRLVNFDVENKVLIGPFSTAQITPKMLYDQEPYLIFTYQLYHDFFGDETSYIENIIGRIRGVYREPKKIFVVKSMAELREVLEKLG